MNKKTKMYKNVVFCTEIADMNNIPACLIILLFYCTCWHRKRGAVDLDLVSESDLGMPK